MSVSPPPATITGTHKDMTDEVEVVVTPAIAPDAN